MHYFQHVMFRRALTVGGRRGFTFVEILIVLLVLGVIAAVGLPALNSSVEDTRLASAVDEIVTAYDYAQMTATASGSSTRVTFDSTRDLIVVQHYRSSADFGLGALAEGAVETGAYVIMERPQRRGVDYSIDLDGESRFGGVQIVAADFGGAEAVTFDEFGTPSSGGSVTLALNDRQQVVSFALGFTKIEVGEIDIK